MKISNLSHSLSGKHAPTQNYHQDDFFFPFISYLNSSLNSYLLSLLPASIVVKRVTPPFWWLFYCRCWGIHFAVPWTVRSPGWTGPGPSACRAGQRRSSGHLGALISTCSSSSMCFPYWGCPNRTNYTADVPWVLSRGGLSPPSAGWPCWPCSCSYRPEHGAALLPPGHCWPWPGHCPAQPQDRLHRAASSQPGRLQ